MLENITNLLITHCIYIYLHLVLSYLGALNPASVGPQKCIGYPSQKKPCDNFGTKERKGRCSGCAGTNTRKTSHTH